MIENENVEEKSPPSTNNVNNNNTTSLDNNNASSSSPSNKLDSLSMNDCYLASLDYNANANANNNNSNATNNNSMTAQQNSLIDNFLFNRFADLIDMQNNQMNGSAPFSNVIGIGKRRHFTTKF